MFFFSPQNGGFWRNLSHIGLEDQKVYFLFISNFNRHLRLHLSEELLSLISVSYSSNNEL